MKKVKTLVFPIVCIALCICAIVFTTVFTTPMVFELVSSRSVYADEINENFDFFRSSRKCGWIMEAVYKNTPSLYNLQVINILYNSNGYLQGTYYGQTPPKGYLEKELKYSKLLYESEYDPNEGGYFAMPMGVDEKGIYWKLGNSFDYMMALYLNGDTDELKKVCEEAISSTEEMPSVFYYRFKDLFYLILADSKDESLKSWVLEKEAYIDSFIKESGNMEKFYTKHDSIFTNPDYDSYVMYKWPENEPGYYNYDE